MKMRKELNNKGFSLVELMIATVILAIVVAPLLHTFVTAATTTARSRQMGDATLAGKNISEMVEASLLSDVLNVDKGFAGVTKDKKKVRLVDGCYYVELEGVQAGSSTFNAKIKFDASAYRTSDPTTDGLNEIAISDYSNMDAVFVQSLGPGNPDVMNRIEFEQDADTHETYRGRWVEDSVETFRTMTLKVTQDEEDDNVSVNLYLDYEYQFSYMVEDATTGLVDYVGATLETSGSPYSIMNDRYPTNRPLNIYVIYYPIYGAAGTTNDIIRIENDIAKPFNLFLVKARLDELDEEVLNKYPEYSNPENKDLQYHATVEQYVPRNTPETQYAVIYSNIAEHLYDPLPPTEELNGVDYRIYRGSYFSRQGYFAGKNGDLVSKSNRDRIFKVTVDIYAPGSATPIHTVNSTKLQ